VGSEFLWWATVAEVSGVQFCPTLLNTSDWRHARSRRCKRRLIDQQPIGARLFEELNAMVREGESTHSALPRGV